MCGSINNKDIILLLEIIMLNPHEELIGGC